MSIALAGTWQPRGELGRLRRLLPAPGTVYAAVVTVLPADAEGAVLRALDEAAVKAVTCADWQHGRHLALEAGLETGADFIHYMDMDRLIRWVETRPDEWRRTVARIPTVDFLLMGRTARAYRTHPQALVQTETVYNLFFSRLLGRDVDLSAGSKAFSRRAAAFVVANSARGRALGADSEWPILVHRAGFAWDYVAVDGLDWETADRYQERAADAERQRRMAAEYDADPRNWAARVQVALEVTRAGLAALERPLNGNSSATGKRK